jgi:hypothetical protein
VLGADPARAGGDWRARIGVVLQESEPEDELTAEECLSLYAGYYPRPRPVDQTLGLVGLAGHRTSRDRIAVLAAGRIVAEGTAATLGGRDTEAAVVSCCPSSTDQWPSPRCGCTAPRIPPPSASTAAG